MSIIYSVIENDTFEIIARKIYGYEGESDRIQAANPGVSEPLSPGTTVIVPALHAGVVRSEAPSNNINEVSITVNGERFRHWTGIQIRESMDGITTVDFTAPFEYDAPGFKEMFKPFSFPFVEVSIGGIKKFTGYLVVINPQITENFRAMTISCYSLPGVLNDCGPSPATYPIEFKNLRIEDISSKILKPSGINTIFLVDQGPPFDKVSCGVSTKIWSFLSTLAEQRELIITNDSNGNLVFTQSTTVGFPVAVLSQGEPPLMSVTPAFNPQNYYSDITGVVSPSGSVDGSIFTVKNPFPIGVMRPHVFTVQDTKGGDVKAVVQAKAGRMFANMVSYTVEVNTWGDPSGNLWTPNTTIKVTAPDAMIYNEYEFLIRNVLLEKAPDREVATLSLVLPGVFSGELPEGLPWD